MQLVTQLTASCWKNKHLVLFPHFVNSDYCWHFHCSFLFEHTAVLTYSVVACEHGRQHSCFQSASILMILSITWWSNQKWVLCGGSRVLCVFFLQSYHMQKKRKGGSCQCGCWAICSVVRCMIVLWFHRLQIFLELGTFFWSASVDLACLVLTWRPLCWQVLWCSDFFFRLHSYHHWYIHTHRPICFETVCASCSVGVEDCWMNFLLWIVLETWSIFACMVLLHEEWRDLTDAILRSPHHQRALSLMSIPVMFTVFCRTSACDWQWLQIPLLQEDETIAGSQSEQCV